MRSGKSPFKGRQFTADVILWAVPGYLQFPISCRAVDARGQTIDFLLSAMRDAAVARRFFRKALKQAHTVTPRTLTVDKNAAQAAFITSLFGVAACVSYLLRRSLEESPEFLRMHSPARNPIRELLREHWKPVLTAVGVVAVVGGFNGMLYGFVPAYLVQTLHYSPSLTALAMMTALLVSSAGLIVAGWAGDYLPRHLVLRVGSGLLLLVVIPIWSRITVGDGQLVLLIGALSLAFAISSGIWPSIVANLFPTRVRFSGIALSYNVSITILSGFAPLTASAMIEWSGMLSAPAIYIAACTLLTFASTFVGAGAGLSPPITLAPEASSEAL